MPDRGRGADDGIEAFDYPAQALRETKDWYPAKRPTTILLTAGASCPDSLIDRVIRKVLMWHSDVATPELALEPFLAEHTIAD